MTTQHGQDTGTTDESSQILPAITLRTLRRDVAPLAALFPELRDTVIDASTGLRYELRDPSRPQTVPTPG